MDAKKKIMEYIQAKKGARITALVMAILTVVFIAGGVVVTFVLNRMGAIPFIPEDKDYDQQAYVDIVGVSDWIYRHGDDIYYCAVDANDYFYTLRMSKSDHSKLEAQQKYFEEEDAPQPEPYRLFGVVKPLGATAKKNLAEWWEVSQTDYTEAFGEALLDVNESKGTQIGIFFFLGAFLTFIFAMIFGVDALITQNRAKKQIRALEEKGLLERAAAQLDAPELTIGKDAARLTEGFFFGAGIGVALPYQDILWCFQRTTKRNGIVTGISLILNTLDKKDIPGFNMGGKDPDNYVTQAMMCIAQHNPNVLLGYSRETIHAYKEMRKNR